MNQQTQNTHTNMCILGLLVHIFVDYTMAVKPPYEIIKDFENALSVYTGAPFVTCVNSCTMALRLCLDWELHELDRDINRFIKIPSRTYISVPIQIKQAGFGIIFEDILWKGAYRLNPTQIWDSARRFHRNMYQENSSRYLCVSFHYSKHLSLGHGGAILHESEGAQEYFEHMRHDGRLDEKPISNENITQLGHHCPMSPEIAAQGLVRLSTLPAYNDDLPNSDYPDLSTFEVFK